MTIVYRIIGIFDVFILIAYKFTHYKSTVFFRIFSYTFFPTDRWITQIMCYAKLTCSFVKELNGKWTINAP